MPKKKEDRRVKFTKMFLKESLIDLLEEKSIFKITIKEICENADINRATFIHIIQTNTICLRA